jgi:hypothetical protein
MTFLLHLIGVTRPPPHHEAVAVIRGFVSTLHRLDAAATGRAPPADVPEDVQ